MARLDRLDHLRAVAIILVISWHLKVKASPGVMSVVNEGHAGVSMFCVISGFILTTIYLQRETPYLSFFKNRVLRIAPLFLFITFLTFYASDWDAGSLLTAITTGLVRGGLPSFAGPGWTVLVEFQFYLLFPFLLIFTRREGEKYLVGLLLIFVLVRAAVWSATGTVQLVAYYSIFGRMDQFLIGMIAGVLLSRDLKLFRMPQVAIAVMTIGITLVIAFFWWFDAHGGLLAFDGGAWPNKSALWIAMPSIEGILFAAIVAGYLHVPQVAALGGLSKIFSYVGLISYSLYLDHVLVIKAVERFELTPTFCLLVVVPVLIAAASMTYYFIERPFMRLRVSGPALEVYSSHLVSGHDWRRRVGDR